MKNADKCFDSGFLMMSTDVCFACFVHCAADFLADCLCFFRWCRNGETGSNFTLVLA